MPIVLDSKLVHKELLTSKLAEMSMDPAKVVLAGLYQGAYDSYVQAFLTAFGGRNFSAMTKALEDYLNFAKAVEKANKKFGARSKYYSSILEEMPVLLATGTVSTHLALNAGAKKTGDVCLFLGGMDCLIRVGASPNGSSFFEKKRIDFCLSVHSKSLKGHVPLVGYEVKKYMDKTMFGTVLETYKALQIFRPRTRYGFLVEDEARDQKVVTNSPLYSSEFVLTAHKRNRSNRNPIDEVCLERFTNQLIREIEEAMDSIT